MDDCLEVPTDNFRGSVRELRAMFETSGSSKPVRPSARGSIQSGDKPETHRNVQKSSSQETSQPVVRRKPRRSLDECRLHVPKQNNGQQLPSDPDESFASYSQTLPSKKKAKSGVERPRSHYDDGRYPQSSFQQGARHVPEAVELQMTNVPEKSSKEGSVHETTVDTKQDDVAKSPEICPSQVQPRTRKKAIVSKIQTQKSQPMSSTHKTLTETKSLETAKLLTEDSSIMPSFSIDSPARKQELKDMLCAPRRLTPPKTSGRVVRKLGKIIYDDIDKTQQETTLLQEQKKSEKPQESPSDEFPKTSGIPTTISESDEAESDDPKEKGSSTNETPSGSVTTATSSKSFQLPEGEGSGSLTAETATASQTSDRKNAGTEKSDVASSDSIKTEEPVKNRDTRTMTTEVNDTHGETRDVVTELKAEDQENIPEQPKLLRNGPRQRMPVPLRVHIGESDTDKPEVRRYKKRETSSKIQTSTPKVGDYRPEFYMGPGSPGVSDIERKLEEWSSRKWKGGDNWTCSDGNQSSEETTKVSRAISDLQSQLMDLKNQDIALLRQLNHMNIIIQEMSIRSSQSRAAPDSNWSATLPSPVRGRAYSSVADLIQMAKTKSLQRSCQPVENRLQRWNDEDQLSELPSVQETIELSPQPRYNRAASVPYVKVTKTLLSKRN